MESIFANGVSYDNIKGLEKPRKLYVPNEEKKSKKGFIGKRIKSDELAKKMKFWALAAAAAIFGSLIVWKVIGKFF